MPTFDIVSKTDLAEVDNALDGVRREISTRFDFKGSAVTLERKDEAITILADDALKLKQVQELVKGYFARRKLDGRALEFKDHERASGNAVRQTVVVKQGIDREAAKTIVKAIKDSKMKVQAAIQGDELRLTGKKRDDLQEAIALVRKLDIDRPLQFVNFRD
ncbi:MAG: YajQ family cyclic di-GMP-binding protein [Rhodospirillales bacterium]|nr:MAG: YajQ family cyclic di-GMP-binding protein [Rhodospirillales bacterium]